MLKEFIAHNDLRFTKGRRNSDLVMICGYSLYKGAQEDEVREALEPFFEGDSELLSEFNRVYDYTDIQDYGSWWSNPANIKAVTAWTPVNHIKEV